MKNLLFTAAALLTMGATIGASAQVTIGTTNIPQSFSILELESNTRGLRLPQMTAEQRKALTINLVGKAEAHGLQIFNIDTKCVDTWNGTKWIEQCGDIDVISPQAFCSGATVDDLEATGLDIKWYDSDTGGEALADNTKLVTGTYYVSQTFNGKESARIAVEVTINTISSPEATITSFCSGNNPTVASIAVTGNDIKWYNALTGGDELEPTDALPVGTATYYASQTEDCCESERTEVTVTVTQTPGEPYSYEQQFCSKNTTTIANLYPSGAGIKWYSSQYSTTELEPTYGLTSGTSYYLYVSRTVNGCEGPRKQVLIKTNLVISPPTITEYYLTFCYNIVYNKVSQIVEVVNMTAGGKEIISPYYDIKWYTSSTGGTAVDPNTDVNSTSLGPYVYKILYASQTVNGCESTNRTGISLSITTCNPNGY